MADYILPYLKNRPLIMKRYPTGIRGQSFHQHDVDEVPEFVDTIALEMEDTGLHTVDYVVCNNMATHLYLANLGAIERHPWHSRLDKLENPDWFVFDLDPGDKVEFETICDVAVIAREVVADLGMKSFAKTSGSRGIHIYVPVRPEYTYDDIAKLAERIAERSPGNRPKLPRSNAVNRNAKRTRSTSTTCRTPTANPSLRRIRSVPSGSDRFGPARVEGGGKEKDHHRRLHHQNHPDAPEEKRRSLQTRPGEWPEPEESNSGPIALMTRSLPHFRGPGKCGKTLFRLANSLASSGF